MTVQPMPRSGSTWDSTIPPTPDSATSVSRSEDDRYVRTQFLRRVAHDIASPTGVTMTVLEELAADAKRPELIVMARRGLKRLLRLSEQLALVADLEAGNVVPDATPEDARTLVKEAIEHATGIDGRRDVTVSSELPETKCSIDVDRRLFVSVVREIVGNALRLASSRVHVQAAVHAGRLEIRVNDDGAGFSPEMQTAVGQRFTARPAPRGLGLSLSIAKEVLAAHGGTLSVGSSSLPPGRRGVPGAQVLVALPCR